MQNYPDYKDSGVEWIGKIPKGWKIKRLGSQFLEKIGSGTTPNSGEPKYYEQEEVPWINTGDLNDGILIECRKKISKQALKDYSTLRIYPLNSLIIAMYGATIGKLAIIKFEACTNQACCVLEKSYTIDNKYLFYLLLSIRKEIISLSYGGGQPNISQDLVKRLRIPFPDILEQQKIADFLDKKNGEINKILQNKIKQIELLKEYEQILINEAVTKGFGNNVKLRKSTYPWIYTLNSNWKERKIQYMTYVKGRIGWQGLTTEEYLDNGEYFLITGTDFNKEEVDWTTCHYVEKTRFDEDPYIQLKMDDVLITKDGSIGKIMQIKDLPKPATLNSGIMVTRPLKGEYIQRFFFWVLKSPVFNEFIEFNKTGSTIAHLYQRVFNNFYFPVPSISEQQQIANYLDEKTSKIRRSIELIETEIQRLEEYKKILINEAVTGKIKVF